MDRRQFLVGLSAAGVIGAAALAGCSNNDTTTPTDGESPGGGDGAGALVGVLMPTKTSQRWIDDGNNVKKALEDKGYKVDLLYANDDIPQQQQQLDAVLGKNAKALIIASIDGTTLATGLKKAGEQGVKVIAYDRLINETPNVDYYVTFDNQNVGVQQGTSLLQGLGVFDAEGKETDKKGPFNVEIFSGAVTDNNSQFFYNGAMSVIQKYIDSGVLKVQSGQTTLEQTATPYWKQEEAQKRCDAILGGFYAQGEKMDGALCAYDGLSRGVLTSIQGAGAPVPIITGQDAEVPSCKLILDGDQYSTILKDTRELAAKAVDMVDAVLQGKEPEVNDTKTYDNKVKVVPAFLLESVVVTKDNLMEVVVDSGYYTKEQVESGK
ncbi:multiple monosaccharide ABC transporter substrate-binding protein [Tessaracoccus antarcticus]|uniref:Sugar ABC transporter substrate-binding protein n=1 Tax=Tessaracoccus antarcticus TaxID=2479848 RepID=A0A3M0G000_9ACTN|nr:multiple monosaccharide ABC transporter substrate-binding protein [Tessaracoccus antarcticus]RMB58270.1 sugar ABC transporter substrate-binding protein [Tessaracoccus antarcticus]